MNQLFFPSKMNVFPKLWKQFGSFFNSNSELKKEKNYMGNNIPFIETQDELTEDDGLRWDQYGNPYILEQNIGK